MPIPPAFHAHGEFTRPRGSSKSSLAVFAKSSSNNRQAQVIVKSNYSPQEPDVEEEEDENESVELEKNPFTQQFTSFPEFVPSPLEEDDVDIEVAHTLADSPAESYYDKQGFAMPNKRPAPRSPSPPKQEVAPGHFRIYQVSKTNPPTPNLPPITPWMVRRLPQTFNSPASSVSSASASSEDLGLNTDSEMSAGVDILGFTDTLSMASTDSDDDDDDKMHCPLPERPVQGRRRGPSLVQRFSNTASKIMRRTRSQSPAKDESKMYRDRS